MIENLLLKLLLCTLKDGVVSLSPVLSVAEDGATVEVCAMLSITSGGTAIANAVTVTLATSDITPGTLKIHIISFVCHRN